jgi:thioredoxin-related protein
MLPLYRIVIIAACLLYMATSWAASADSFFDQTLGDFREELESAKKAGKGGVLLMFEAEGCPYCRKMRSTVLNRADVQDYFKSHFANFTVDILGAVPVTDFAGKETTEARFAQSMRVLGTPTFLFISLDGAELARYTGATRDAEEFLHLGKYVVGGHFKHQTLDTFLNSAAKP